MKYTNHNQLKGKELSNSNTVIFNVNNNEYRYYVTHAYLLNLDGYNDEIFRELQINKWKFCRRIYGYIPTNFNQSDRSTNKSFPECRYNDYTALTKITVELFRLCEKINTPKFNKIKMI